MRTIRAKLTVFTIVVSITFALIMSIIFYNNYHDLLIENMTKVSKANLGLVMDNIDEDLRSAQTISEWISINPYLESLIINYDNSPSDKRNMLVFWNDLRTLVNSSKVGGKIEKILITNEDRFSVQLGLSYGHHSDEKMIIDTSWFKKAYDNNNSNWQTISANPFRYKSSKQIIPSIRPIYSHLRSTNIGWSYIAISADLMQEHVRDYSVIDGSQIAVIDQNGIILSHNQDDFIGTTINNSETILKAMSNTKEGSFDLTDKEFEVATFYRSDLTGWYVLHYLSATEINAQKQILVEVIVSIIVSMIVIGLVLSLFIGTYINKPIDRISKRVKKISQGDFSYYPEYETDDEIGVIGKVLNQMATDIQDLMNRTVQNEADKRRLELNVLQTQVNPHFLYNTLNSIKWMATIQRNSGISEMTTALSRLLRNMAKGVSDKISLEEELSIVKDYVLIQQYRYSDKFVVDYNIDQSILKYKIVKFTLQPLVENAIFHGIAPGEQSGTIVIEAKKVLDNIEISVIDSGVGMTSNQLNEVLQNTHSKKDRLNSIGISNVRERLMLIYGESYGLSISSQQNYGTIVVITIPCEE